MATNIKIVKPNMTIVDGYFFTFNETIDILFEITADGTTAFSYPLDTPITNEVRSTEYDGVNFWTLEEGAVAGEDMAIKRWRIDNYICKLQEEFLLDATGSDKYSSEAFTVEHYHTTISGTYLAGASVIGITSSDYDTVLTNTMEVTLGPNTDGYFETIGVTSISGTQITLDTPTEYGYVATDNCQFYTNVWLFNDWSGLTANAGALYKLDPYSSGAPNMNILTKYSGAVYQGVEAATFYNVGSFYSDYGNVDTLAYVKASNLLFVNINENPQSSLDYYGSMAMDNASAGAGTISAVIDIAMDVNNIYRLQYIETGNNYRLSTLESLVASVALEASRAIVPANGVTTTTITATVRDQFFQPFDNKLVDFDQDGDGAFTDPGTKVATSPAGEASKVYNVGTNAIDVTMTATVDQ